MYPENKIYKDRMMTHDIRLTPWSKIIMDICYFEGRALLIVSDY